MSNLYNNGFNQMLQVDATTTALGSNGTYTSATFTSGGNARIVGTVFANQAGTVEVDQSPDGTNWDAATQSFAITASTSTNFSVEVVAPFARVRYTNGASAQTTFRLYTFTRGV